MEERFLYHIWDAGHLLTPLKTASGKALQVNYQGQFNTDRGPDFRNVIVNLNGEILRGDVEIHLNSNDWNAHEHHEDPHYNKVILHVVMNAGQQQYTIKQNGEATEILELKDQLSEDIRKLLETPVPEDGKRVSTYCDLLSAVDNDALESTLTAWGMRRFRNKVRRFNATLLFSDFDQALYEGMMEALGYDKNKQNMLTLAQSIPLRSVREWQSEGMTALELVSVLCCASGLLKRSRNHLDAALYAMVWDTYEHQHYFAQNLEIPWQLFRIRPASHPIYRIFAIASLIHKTYSQGFLDYWLEQAQPLNSRARQAFSAFTNVFTDSAMPGAEKLPKPGKGLIGNIYVNIFLPVSYMYFEKHSDAEAQQRILEFYAGFPALQENHITRHMGRYLSPAHNQLANSKTVLQQGLIELFHRFCNYHLCSECAAAKP
mgnify:CR=1 FL=1|jgi:hypothetical protein